MERQIGQTVDQINALGTQLQQYNVQRRTGDSQDASFDAKIQTTLESLSQLTNFTATMEADGTVTVLAGGQTPLVIGDQQYKIVDRLAAPANLPPGSPGVPPVSSILDSAGRDVTAQFTAGNWARYWTCITACWHPFWATASSRESSIAWPRPLPTASTRS